jgi:hypothetical protein
LIVEVEYPVTLKVKERLENAAGNLGDKGVDVIAIVDPPPGEGRLLSASIRPDFVP